MKAETILEVFKKLNGSIEPQGASHIDDKIMSNLQCQIHITETLIDEIILVARHKDRHEHSMKICGKEANEFINRLKERLSE